MVRALMHLSENSVITLFFFFFQAEDGIRDYKVTGVQTCALPIYQGRVRAGDADDRARYHGTVHQRLGRAARRRVLRRLDSERRRGRVEEGDAEPDDGSRQPVPATAEREVRRVVRRRPGRHVQGLLPAARRARHEGYDHREVSARRRRTAQRLREIPGPFDFPAAGSDVLGRGASSMSAFFERVRAALAPKGCDVLRELGSGGMGAVFLARQVALDWLVAIKVLRPELATADGAERFHREARTPASLGHPNIVPIHDYGESR